MVVLHQGETERINNYVRTTYIMLETIHCEVYLTRLGGNSKEKLIQLVVELTFITPLPY